MADDLPILLFASPPGLEAWLEENHAESDGFWLKIAKKGSGESSVTYAEALELALCFGWIDSQKRGFDEEYFLQRFTPRRPRGRWSRINRDKAEALIAAKAIRPAGLAEVEAAKADGRWEAAYEGASARRRSPRTCSASSTPTGPPASSSRASTAATATRSSTGSNDAKKPQTRERRLRKFVAMLERGEKIHE